MKKIIISLICFVMLFSLSACNRKPSTTTTADSTPSEYTTPKTDSKEDEYMNKTIELKIDNQIVDVTWLDNPSVKALKELAKNGLTINMHEYGDFEQTGMDDFTIKKHRNLGLFCV